MNYRMVTLACFLYAVLWVALGYDAVKLLPAMLAGGPT